MAFLALPAHHTSFLELAARSPRTLHDLLESGDLFCPINFLKGQKWIAELKAWPGKHTDEEPVA